MNVVSLSGRVAQDIKLIETSNDNHVITINLAVKSDYYKAGEEPKTDFLPVTRAVLSHYITAPSNQTPNITNNYNYILVGIT